MGTGSQKAPDVDALLGAGPPPEGLDARRALAAFESKVFGRSRRQLRLSRYVLLDRLGAGGGGMVYRAFDPELGRKVAIKLLLTSADTDGRGRRRLLQEAQAMAQLSHPNVVPVYDVGTYAEFDLGYEEGEVPDNLEIPPRGIFVVMEFIKGLDLADWVGRERSLDEILDVFIAAGRGLEAAHHQGIVHRDFKPGNVFVGDDGRVRVGDFGLARAGAANDGDAGTTVLVGTPVYMAPEQHRGSQGDERCDQFAFAATLHEALFLSAPYDDADFRRLYESKVARAKLPAKYPRRIPARLAAALERALSPDPAQRFATLGELIAALEAVRGRARRRLVWGAAASTLAAGLIGAAASFGVFAESADPCAGSEQAIAQVWSEERRNAVRERLIASGVPWAEVAGEQVVTYLDDYTSRWASMHREACEATRIRGEQSLAMLDRRMACLDRHLAEADAVIGVLELADAATSEHAVGTVRGLGRLDSCADLDALQTRVDLPEDPETRAEVERLDGRVAEARARTRAAHYAEGLALVDAVIAEAQELGYLPLLARARAARASVLLGRGEFEEAEQELLAAIWAAEESRDDSLAADAWVELVWIVGVERRDVESGRKWAQFAQAADRRAAPNPLRTARLDHNLGGLYYTEGEHARALDHYMRALETQERVLGEDDPIVARTLNHIGNVLIMAKDVDRAEGYCERSLDIRRRTLGSDHPKVAAALNNLAIIRTRQGRSEEGLAAAREALRVVEGRGVPEEQVARRIIRDVERDIEEAAAEPEAPSGD